MTGFDLSRRAHKREVPTPAATFADTMAGLDYLGDHLLHQIKTLREGRDLLICALFGLDPRRLPRQSR